MPDDEKKFVLPGDEIGESEEYIAGEGTFEKDGKIYSAITGYLEIDMNEKTAFVKSATSTPVILEPGSVILGVIYDKRGSLALVNVVKTVDKTRSIAMGDTTGSLHVSRIMQSYLKEIGEAYKAGDIVRAEVVQVEPSLQLSTEADNMGVILANCLDCQLPLKLTDKVLECPGCERKYHRKIANDFGVIDP